MTTEAIQKARGQQDGDYQYPQTEFVCESDYAPLPVEPMEFIDDLGTFCDALGDALADTGDRIHILMLVRCIRKEAVPGVRKVLCLQLANLIVDLCEAYGRKQS